MLGRYTTGPCCARDGQRGSPYPVPVASAQSLSRPPNDAWKGAWTAAKRVRGTPLLGATRGRATESSLVSDWLGYQDSNLD